MRQKMNGFRPSASREGPRSATVGARTRLPAVRLSLPFKESLQYIELHSGKTLVYVSLFFERTISSDIRTSTVPDPGCQLL